MNKSIILINIQPIDFSNQTPESILISIGFVAIATVIVLICIDKFFY